MKLEVRPLPPRTGLGLAVVHLTWERRPAGGRGDPGEAECSGSHGWVLLSALGAVMETVLWDATKLPELWEGTGALKAQVRTLEEDLHIAGSQQSPSQIIVDD